MYRRALASLIAVVALAATTSAQTPSLPTPTPASAVTVTAENEQWYLRGEPITYEGFFYYPAGAALHLNRSEMVRSGFYRGIPIFSRTTVEPFSVIYVPIAGGLVQPYERPRFGEIAGTVGSSGSAFPVPLADTRRVLTDAPQAPSAPTMLQETIAERTVGVGATGTAPVAVVEDRPVGTTGVRAAESVATGTAGRAVVLPRPRRIESVLRPTGVNGIYVEFEGARWFSSGTAVTFDSAEFQRIGQHHGFPVYARIGGDAATIYIPTAAATGSLLAPYSRREAMK